MDDLCVSLNSPGRRPGEAKVYELTVHAVPPGRHRLIKDGADEIDVDAGGRLIHVRGGAEVARRWFKVGRAYRLTIDAEPGALLKVEELL